MKNKTPHNYVPEHIKLDDSEKEQVLKQFNVDFQSLPRIRLKDPLVKELKVKEGDVVKIIRKSPTAGEVIFYRGVINE